MPDSRRLLGRMTASSRSIALALFVAGTVIGLLEAVQLRFLLGASWGVAFAVTMPAWYVKAILFPVIAWLAARFPFTSATWPRSLPVHAAACVAYIALFLGVASYVSDYVLRPDGFAVPYAQNFRRLLETYFITEILYYWAVVIATHAVMYHRARLESDRRAAHIALRSATLERELVQAQLENLRVQIQPHFLFNTLHSISALAAREGNEEVIRMISALSDLLRRALDEPSSFVTLGEEVRFITAYAELEKMRLGDRLEFRLSIGDGVLEVPIPNLLLQPLVENSIQHGVAPLARRGTVELRAERVDGSLQVVVLDTGPGFPPVRRRPSGIGLRNTRERLEHIYEGAASLVLGNRPEGGAEVIVRVPLEHPPESAGGARAP